MTHANPDENCFASSNNAQPDPDSILKEFNSLQANFQLTKQKAAASLALAAWGNGVEGLADHQPTANIGATFAFPTRSS